MGMQMKKRDKKARKIGLRVMLLLLSSTAVAITAITVTLLASMALRQGMQDKALDGLRAVATTVAYSINELSAGGFSMQGEDMYKGEYNITANMEYLDNIATQNNVDITFFYGDVRRATTMTDSTGERILGTKADSDVVNTVLNNRGEFESTNMMINNQSYYAYYLPLVENNGECVGMLFAGQPSEENEHYISSRSNFLIIMAIVITVICVGLAGFTIDKEVLKPFLKLAGIAKEMAKGNIGVDTKCVTTIHEIGDMADAYTDMVGHIGNQARVAEKVSDGDLTVVCPQASEEDVMGKSLKKMLRDNNKNLSVIRDSANRMASGANEVASASNSLAQGTTEQASAIEEITASIEEIANGAKINAEDANTANELVQNTKEGAIRGNEQMNKMIAAMQDINESSENISKIMKVIDDIAFQTNILALNASVEAARAGVHGKGFAVVAEEVRNLASKSGEAAKDSAELIDDSIRKVEIGSKLAADTAKALEEILGSVENIATLVSRIADASANQATSVGQVNAGITQIADVVQTNSATSEQCAAASAELSNLAGQLLHAVGKYKLLSARMRKPVMEEDFFEEEEDSFVDNEDIISLDGDFGKY
ncbi:MAG: methyl-accepting chemotaxis protein [Lachnospiraceae bacterium]|nr:methyl-accepting chemotaxis protein [Lachnospiraceae bacterium]